MQRWIFLKWWWCQWGLESSIMVCEFLHFYYQRSGQDLTGWEILTSGILYNIRPNIQHIIALDTNTSWYGLVLEAIANETCTANVSTTTKEMNALIQQGSIQLNKEALNHF